MPNASKYDRLLTIREAQKAKSNNGEESISSWNSIYTDVPCKYVSGGVGGNKIFDGTQRVGQSFDSFIIRYNNSITQAMELIYEGSNYTIISVVEGIGRRQETVINATAKDNS